MGYVRVLEDSGERLRLCREPSVRAWALCMGLISLGIGAAYYSADYILWKIAYISGSVFVALSSMEDWEECTLDKETGQVLVKTETLIHKLFQATHGQKTVTGDLQDVVDVVVESEDMKYGGTSYMVVLKFGAGYSIGVTETATVGDRSDHQEIADKIYRFLELDKKPSSTSEGQISGEASGEDASTEEEELEEEGADLEGEDSAHSDESFERIEKADIPEDLDHEAEAVPSHPHAAQKEASMSQEVSSSSEGK